MPNINPINLLNILANICGNLTHHIYTKLLKLQSGVRALFSAYARVKCPQYTLDQNFV